jgi:hypothetical protein
MESADNSAAEQDMASETAGKRPKKPSAKMISTDDYSKQQKMVLSDELLCMIGEHIQGDPDAWGIMLTKSRGKGNVQLKFIQHISKYPNEFLNISHHTSRTQAQKIKVGQR